MRIGTSVKSVQFRGVLAGFAALLIPPITVFGANSASADSIQHQSYQRGSQSEACAAQSGETPWQASWGSDSSWKPTWEQWANGGKGGWTCTRAITWARTPVAGGSSSVTYQLGDIGPGGGLVFLISGGLTYEMAPNTWSSGSQDPSQEVCSNYGTPYAGASGTAVGTGFTNTAELVVESVNCNSEAAAAVRAYGGTDSSTGQWFLPSKDELNAMYNYSQVSGFNAVTYGFRSGSYWSSSRFSPTSYSSWWQSLLSGSVNTEDQDTSYYVRPIRTF